MARSAQAFWHSIYMRANRWAKQGVLETVFAALQEKDVINIGVDHVSLEAMQTGPLVRDKAFEFFFVLGSHRVRGTVQAMIDPIAIY